MASLPMVAGGGSYTSLGQPELLDLTCNVTSSSYSVSANGTYLLVAIARPADITNSTGNYIYYDKTSGGYNRTITVMIATLSNGDSVSFTGTGNPIFAVYKLSSFHIASTYTKLYAGAAETSQTQTITCDDTKKYFFIAGSAIGTVAVTGYNVGKPTSGNYRISAEYIADYDKEYTKFAKASDSWNVVGLSVIQFS